MSFRMFSKVRSNLISVLVAGTVSSDLAIAVIIGGRIALVFAWGARTKSFIGRYQVWTSRSAVLRLDPRVRAVSIRNGPQPPARFVR